MVGTLPEASEREVLGFLLEMLPLLSSDQHRECRDAAYRVRSQDLHPSVERIQGISSRTCALYPTYRSLSTVVLRCAGDSCEYRHLLGSCNYNLKIRPKRTEGANPKP